MPPERGGGSHDREGRRRRTNRRGERDEPRGLSRHRSTAAGLKPDPSSAEDVRAAQASGRERFLRTHDVSRETLDRLDAYVALLTTWQARINLVAPDTLGDVWTRHIADSFVLDAALPSFGRAIDLGSGGGLPGIVVAAIRAEAGGRVDLVESNAKKAAFLRAAQRTLGLDGIVHADRVEACGPALAAADIVTARALAPLDMLLGMVTPHLKPGARCFFQKGRNHEQEIAAASAHWRFTMLRHPSTLDESSIILEIADVEALAR